MIFVVVGTQEPFDRLIGYLDEWSAMTGYHDIYAQIANANYRPTNFEYTEFIQPQNFYKKFKEADLIVSHSGMGTIISALQFSKPIIVMPRLSMNKEHRNNHQIATAKGFEKLGYIKAVYNKNELFYALNGRYEIKPGPLISSEASKDLIDAIKTFLQ